MFDPRQTYHDVRRVLTSAKLVPHYPDNTPKWHVSRPYNTQAALKRAMDVKLPRGHAEFRKVAVKALLDRKPDVQVSLPERFKAYIAKKYRAEIARRGGETHIAEESRNVFLSLHERRDGLVLLRAEGWRQYSRRFGARKASLAYLCGSDDNGPWAVRVPGTCYNISTALDHIKPAEVCKAEASGKRVLRQGDVYIVERTRDAANWLDLPGNHSWDPETRILSHDDGHADLHVPFPCKFVPQSTLRMGRLDTRPGTRRTGRGD